MKLIVTGASGFVGRWLVPFLHEQGYHLVLLGRDEAKLRALFPDFECHIYQDGLSQLLNDCDACLHLATRNNDQDGGIEDFRRDNVEALSNLMDNLLMAGVKKHIYVSSIRANEMSQLPYDRSKWEAERLLQDLANTKPEIDLRILRLAAVVHGAFVGKLAVLNRFPAFVQRFLFKLLAALRPTVSTDRVTRAIIGALSGPADSQSPVSIVSDEQRDNFAYSFAVRLIDWSFSLTILVFLGWVFPIFVLLIRMDSPGNALFSQPRVGKDGKIFLCRKFRTMRAGTKQAGTHEVQSHAVTRIGSFMRASKIDELPQIWNLMRGDMSLVGPRPCLPVQEQLVKARTDRGVLDIRPGITGYAQVRNIDMSDPDYLAKIDADYLAQRSVPLDIKLILATATGKGMEDKVSKA